MSETPCIWLTNEELRADTYAAFRGNIHLKKAAQITVRTLGASWYRVWLDGKFLTEGPVRFEPGHPEYEEQTIELAAGEHIIAAQVHHIGLATRMLPDLPPFFWCQTLAGKEPIEIEWHCQRLGGYESEARRLNPQFGWIECCNLQAQPDHWQTLDFDATEWHAPAIVTPELADFTRTPLAHVPNFEHRPAPLAEGPLATTFGYERDDIPAVFFLRDLECKALRPEGFWRRYDLGRVRLMRPEFVIDAPAGTIVEFAYAEQLTHGRVAPYIPLSAGASCNLDHYVCREGRQTISPLTPRGGRFVEIHVLPADGEAKIIEERFIERCYHDAPEGAFECENPLLNRIWEVGVETYRACSEDALVDNPTRERGQWTGDVVTVGMDICSVAYEDLSLLRRGLAQSAWCAREDGLISGMCPGGLVFLSSYAELWVNACCHYYRITGDGSLLEEMYPYAMRNIEYFCGKWTPEGLSRDLDWIFIDWGYVTNDGPSDMAANLHLRNTLRAMMDWCRILGKEETIPELKAMFDEVTTVVSTYLADCLTQGEAGWAEIGIHRAALALGQDLFDAEQQVQCIEFIKRHYLNCFPNNTEAPRLGKPSDENPQLITPYFSHYVFPMLIERGEMDFVLGQYETCWGWALEEDRTTWVEVFDPRWSHCHQWSGCPTWQLSRYGLGLHPRFDLGEGHYELKLHPGSLNSVRGKLPAKGQEQPIAIEWQRTEGRIDYKVSSTQPITIHHLGQSHTVEGCLQLMLEPEATVNV